MCSTEPPHAKLKIMNDHIQLTPIAVGVILFCAAITAQAQDAVNQSSTTAMTLGEVVVTAKGDLQSPEPVLRQPDRCEIAGSADA